MTELIIVLAIAAIMASLAGPSMVSFLASARFQINLGRVVSDINFARGEAVKRRKHIIMGPKINTDWKDGWRIFVDADEDDAYDSNETVLLIRDALSGGELSVKDKSNNATDFILYHPSGISKDTGAITLTSLLNNDRRDMCVVNTGRLKLSSCP